MTDQDFLPLFVSASRQRCQEYALVLQAVGIPCQITPEDRGFALLVRARDALGARHQLALYAAENPPQTHRPAPLYPAADGFNTACLFGVTILALNLGQRNQAFGLDWVAAGSSQAGLIVSGEWWRAFTALGLHADPQHLLGNLVLGLIFSFLAGQRLGWGLAWAGLILAGALGNGLNAAIQPESHNSIGASTAVFATLGILCVFGWVDRGGGPAAWTGRGRSGRGFGRWAPLGAGIALLAFLGMEGPRTDIFAHATGFLAGCLFGLAFYLWEIRGPITAQHQALAGGGATALFALAWIAAL